MKTFYSRKKSLSEKRGPDVPGSSEAPSYRSWVRKALTGRRVRLNGLVIAAAATSMAFSFSGRDLVFLSPLLEKAYNILPEAMKQPAKKAAAPEKAATAAVEGKPAAARAMAPQGAFPLQRGMALVGRLSSPDAFGSPLLGSNPKGYVLGVFDIRNPGANGAPAAVANWADATNSAYRHPDWINEKLGEIFGIEIDNSVPAAPQVFVGSSGSFVGYLDGAAEYAGRTLPAAGSEGGDVFRIDGNTGNVSTLTSVIPSVAYHTTGGRGASAMKVPLNTSQGRVKSVTINNGGTGYSTFDPLVFSGGTGTVQATGYVVATGGVVTSIVLTNQGAGYGTTPVNVTVNSPGGGTGFSGTVVLGYPLQLGNIVPTSGGSGYTGGIVAEVKGDGTGGAATQTYVGGTLTNYNIWAAGLDYTYEPTVTINNRYTGVGNVGYNYAQKVVYVTSLDNGNIYAIDATSGALLGAPFDHLSSVGDPATAMTDLRRLAIGMAWNPRDNRLYFSRPNAAGYTTVGTTYDFTHNEIVSIGLNADGSINQSDAIRQEANVPVTKLAGPAGQASLITDIEFTSDGNIALLGEMSTGAARYTSTEARFIKGSHNAIAREYRFNGTAWTLNTDYHVGNSFSGYNNTGGVDFGYGNSENPEIYYDAAVLGGDFLNGVDIYGIQISPLSQGNYPTNTPFRHYLVDDNPASIGTAAKTGIGDIDVFSGVDYPAEPIALGTITDPTACGNADGIITITSPGIQPNTPYPISYVKDGGAPVLVSLTSDANGIISITGLSPGVYTAIKINDPPTYVSNELSATLKCTVNLSGTVFHDANGLKDTPSPTVNGTGIQQTDSDPLYANLFDDAGTYLRSVAVDAAGNFLFENVDPNTPYTITVSTTQAAAGSTPAGSTGLTAGWVHTGQHLGDGPGSDGTVDGILEVAVATTDVTDANFGVNHLPESTTLNLTLTSQPVLNQMVPLDGTNGATPLSGFDPEDQPANGPLTGKTVAITSLPANSELWYNGTRITVGDDGVNPVSPTNPYTIASLNPADMSVKLTEPGSTSTSFTYAYVDAAGFPDPTPATYTINWPDPLASGLMLSGTVFHDANGLNDTPSPTVNGTGIQQTGSDQLYANLFSATGTYLRSVAVDANGHYEFANVDANTIYIVTVSITQASAGSTPATSTGLTANWVNTGEHLGADPGSDGTVDGILQVAVATTDVVEANFGVNQRPQPADVTSIMTTAPTLGQLIPLDGTNGADPLEGTDPEDQPGGGPLGGKTIAITSLPTTSELWYNGTQILLGDDNTNPVSPTNPKTIPDLVSSNLAIKPTTPTATGATFTYNYIDEAGTGGVTPATYTLTWGALPVAMAGFDVRKEGSSAFLTWSTTMERNSAYFEIQRGKDGANWVTLGKVNAAGQSEKLNRYSFTDSRPARGINLYRIRIVDLDGSVDYSNIKSVDFGGSILVRLSPNPVSDLLKIELNDWEAVKQVRILDASGRQVYASGKRPAETIDVRRLTAGVHLVAIEHKDGTVSTHRVVIVR